MPLPRGSTGEETPRHARGPRAGAGHSAPSWGIRVKRSLVQRHISVQSIVWIFFFDLIDNDTITAAAPWISGRSISTC
jgi:hypothetical protein